MSSFERGCAKQIEVERLSRQQLMPFLRDESHNGQLVLTDKGTLSTQLQKSGCDVLFNTSQTQTFISVEIKAEEKNDWDRFFFEYWTNRQKFTLGWIHTCKADILLYHFLNNGVLYAFPWLRLREWMFHDPSRGNHPGRMYDFVLRKQRKQEQLNDTWGYTCDISAVIQEVKCNTYRLENSVWRRDVSLEIPNLEALLHWETQAN